MKTIPTLTWYLQMDHEPLLLNPGDAQLPDSYRLSKLHKPDPTVYLNIYNSVGGRYNWFDRVLMPKDELSALLEGDNIEIQVLYNGDEPAGFVEYDISHPDETEIVYFGLVDSYTGKKLGLPFLNLAIRHAFTRDIKRLWLHTCDLDHKSALPLYLKAGFVIFKEEIIHQPVK